MHGRYQRLRSRFAGVFTGMAGRAREDLFRKRGVRELP